MVSRAMSKGKVKKYRMKKKAAAGCGPKYGCGKGKHGTGCGMKDKYGGGTGNFEGKQAPPFTDKVNPTDMPQAFGKKAGLFDSAEQKADRVNLAKAKAYDKAHPKQVGAVNAVRALKDHKAGRPTSYSVRKIQGSRKAPYKPTFDMQADAKKRGNVATMMEADAAKSEWQKKTDNKSFGMSGRGQFRGSGAKPSPATGRSYMPAQRGPKPMTMTPPSMGPKLKL